MGPTFCLDESGDVLDVPSIFPRPIPVVLDIGFGQGEATSAAAIAHRHVGVIAIDVHTPGIVRLLAQIDEHDIDNLRLVHGDALIFIDRLPPESLAGVRIYFPDPWPKNKQRRRRLVRPKVVDRLVHLLEPGGWIHLATDMSDYATQMQRVCDAHHELVGGIIERPATRAVTRYERKGLEAGRTPTDLLYIRGDAVGLQT